MALNSLLILRCVQISRDNIVHQLIFSRFFILYLFFVFFNCLLVFLFGSLPFGILTTSVT